MGLSLSLFVLLDQKISDGRFRTLSFFHMGVVAFLTTLIQGATMKPLLQVCHDSCKVFPVLVCFAGLSATEAQSIGINSIINATGLGACICPVQFMGLVKPSTVKRGFLRRLLREVEEHGDRKLDYAGYDRLLGDPDYHLLRQLTTLDVGQMLKRYVSKLHVHGSHDHIGVCSFSADLLHVA